MDHGGGSIHAAPILPHGPSLCYNNHASHGNNPDGDSPLEPLVVAIEDRHGVAPSTRLSVGFLQDFPSNQ